MSKDILIIDDDALMRRSLAFNLRQAGYNIRAAASAEDGLAMIAQELPDLVLLDVGLPGMDGLDALKSIRERKGLPVIMVTARRRELDEILGLELGADDYVTKPFDLSVMLAHIKAVLRRSQSHETLVSAVEIIQAGDLEIDPGAHTAILAGNILNLSPKEFNLLFALVSNSGKLVTTDDLLARAWGAEFLGQPQVVYVHIRWLREKIEDDPQNPRRIVTVRGLGYRYLPLED